MICRLPTPQSFNTEWSAGLLVVQTVWVEVSREKCQTSATTSLLKFQCVRFSVFSSSLQPHFPFKVGECSVAGRETIPVCYIYKCFVFGFEVKQNLGFRSLNLYCKRIKNGHRLIIIILFFIFYFRPFCLTCF